MTMNLSLPRFLRFSIAKSLLRSTSLSRLAALVLLCGGLVRAARAGSSAPAPFVLGADISALAAPYRHGPYAPLDYKENGVRADELTILRRHGWNAFRLRVFVPPVRQAPDNTVEADLPLAREIKASGATFLLCLHFSDTWADPQHQDIPVAWRGLSYEQLAAAWEQHAYDTVRRLKEAGAMPDWVQIGNEITRGTMWPVAQLKVPGSTEYNPPEPYDEEMQWHRLAGLLKAGIRGVLRAAGDTPPRIAIHIDKGGNWEVTKWFFDHLATEEVPYDIIAESFYPPWKHGTLEDLKKTMEGCARRYRKDFLVVETGYGRSMVPNNPDMLWPQTPQGRLQYLEDLIRTVKSEPHGIGVMYWAPERDLWNPDGTPGPGVSVLQELR